MAKHFAAYEKAFLPYYLVSCWHLNEFESAAMWRLYFRETNSVALLTRFNLLVDALPVDFGIGKVKYIDCTKEHIPEGNMFNQIMYKRKSFEHECEVRAVKIDDALDANILQKLYDSSEEEWKLHVDKLEPGLDVRVEVAQMTEAIRVSPGSPGWFVKTVEGIVKRCGYNFPGDQSELDRDPVY